MIRTVLPSIVAGMLIVAPGLRARTPDPQPSSRFLTLWSMYRHGDGDAAVDAFSKWKPRDVAVEALLPPDQSDPWSKAALVLLHTEAAMRNNSFARWNDKLPGSINDGGWGLVNIFEVHSHQASLIVRDLTSLAKRSRDDRLRAFVRQWYIVAMSYCLRWRLQYAMEDLWDLADHDFGDDVEVRLLMGAIAESRASHGIRASPKGVGVTCLGIGNRNGPHGCVAFSPPSRGPGNGQEALFEYRHALEQDPTLDEAHLRLGRMLHLVGQNVEARVELTRALESDVPGHRSFVTYLAALFLGEIEEESGEMPAAIAHYREGVNAFPLGHMGHLMLGQALVRSGDTDGWQELQRMFAGESAASPAAVDPWALYPYAQYWQLVPRLLDMRREVRR